MGQQEDEEPPVLPQPLLDSISARQGEEVTTESLIGVSQKMASFKVDLNNQSLLLNYFILEDNVREKARLASLGLPHAGDWLGVVPMLALGLKMRGPEFVACLKYRLGIPLFSADGPCPACQLPSDRMGDHALGCSKYGDRIARHNLLRDVIFETAAGAALGPAREGRFLLPGTAARPADVLIPRWSDGKDGALDVTVSSSLCQSNVAGAAAEAGSCLQKAFDRKVQGAAEACREQGLVFIPMAVEALGGMHSVTIQQLKQLGSALGRQTGQEESVAIGHLFQRFSLHLMKGNASMLVTRRPDVDFLGAEVDGSE